tara:strand:- start:2000 stop:2950 length:951 start_codon:yes stop_codon:yes gene_type:complete
MTKLKGILLTGGMHGMISQAEGLAKSLDIEFIHERIELNNFWKLIPPKFTPIKNFAFKNKIEKNFNIVISCGRKSVIPSLYLKQKFKKKIINIHIQDPKVSLKKFDFVIIPEHDNIIGENVLTTKGAIHYLRDNELAENENYLRPKINKKKLVLLLIGGPNKYYDYNDKSVEAIFLKIRNIFLQKGYQLIFIPSMRTPKKVIESAKNYFDKNHIVISEIDKKAYLSALKLANQIVVTCDSTSMISEAAMTGKPIYVAQMQEIKRNHRFKKFFELFKSMNIIKDLDNSIDEWSYKKLNESDRVSSYIKEKIKNYDLS